jgi:hypothetical protein
MGASSVQHSGTPPSSKKSACSPGRISVPTSTGKMAATSDRSRISSASRCSSSTLSHGESAPSVAKGARAPFERTGTKMEEPNRPSAKPSSLHRGCKRGWNAAAVGGRHGAPRGLFHAPWLTSAEALGVPPHVDIGSREGIVQLGHKLLVRVDATVARVARMAGVVKRPRRRSATGSVCVAACMIRPI